MTLSSEAVLLLSRLQGIEIPPEDVEDVRVALSAHLESVKVLEELDLTDVEPIVHFDPRWR
jgi:Asp-tRNA(Asn)/Glu-tRNA(Gln) amidotransferase C subunit